MDSGYTTLVGSALPKGQVIPSRPAEKHCGLRSTSGTAEGATRASACTWETVAAFGEDRGGITRHAVEDNIRGDRGKSQERQLATLPVIGYPHQVARQILLVFVRDSADPDAVIVFFITDLTRTGPEVVHIYVLHWPIEATFHDVKQYLGGEDPPSSVDPAQIATSRYGF